jgi:hypothetical protein
MEFARRIFRAIKVGNDVLVLGKIPPESRIPVSK